MAFGGVSRYAFTASVTALFDGAAVVSVPVDPVGTLKMLALFEVTDLLTTPVAMRNMVDAMEQHHLKAPSVKRISLTGSLVSPELLKRVEANFAARIRIGYGTSEVAGITSASVTAATFQRGYVGEVRHGVTLVSAGTRDEPGPVVIANPPDMRTMYIAGGKLITDDRPTVTLPDLGYIEGKALFLVGRADEVYNFSGNKLPYDVLQREIERQAPVTDVGIVGGGPIGRDDDLIVAVVAEPPLDLSGVRERVLNALGWTKAMAHVHFLQVPAVPRNAMGKVDRGGVLHLYSQRAALPV
jgi:acyl-coenzyme A synthetase/AMP-(fatty) acid ligase